MSNTQHGFLEKLRENVATWIFALIAIVCALVWPLTKWNSAGLKVPLGDEYVISDGGKIERAANANDFAYFTLFRDTAGLFGKGPQPYVITVKDIQGARFFADRGTLAPEMTGAFGATFPSSSRWEGLNLGEGGSTGMLVFGRATAAAPNLLIESKGRSGVLSSDEIGRVYVYTTAEVCGLILIGVIIGFFGSKSILPIWDLLKKASVAEEKPVTGRRKIARKTGDGSVPAGT